MYNPINKGEVSYIERTVANRTDFDKIVGNAYFSKRLESNTKVGSKEDLVRISIRNDFKVSPPHLNTIWFKVRECLENSEYWNTYYIAAYIAIALSVLFWSYHIIFRKTSRSEANRLVNIILNDMREKNLYRNGLSLYSIYDWYSSETTYSKPEFEAKILPHISEIFQESNKFRKSKNRIGETVWNLA